MVERIVISRICTHIVNTSYRVRCPLQRAPSLLHCKATAVKSLKDLDPLKSKVSAEPLLLLLSWKRWIKAPGPIVLQYQRYESHPSNPRRVLP